MDGMPVLAPAVVALAPVTPAIDPFVVVVVVLLPPPLPPLSVLVRLDLRSNARMEA